MDKGEYTNMYNNEMSHWWYVILHNLIIQFIKTEFGENKSISILDAGCGTGGFLSKLSDYPNKEGFDFSSDAIDFCHQRGLSQCFIQDLNTWKSDQKYDVIVSSDVLYHKNIMDEQIILNNFYEALNPGGVLILNLPAFEILKRKHDIVVQTKKRFNKNDLLNFHRNSNFNSVNVYYRLPLLFFIVLAQKLREKMKKQNTSDIGSVSTLLNSFMIKLFIFENHFFKYKLTLPFGTSVIGVYKK